MKQPKASHKQRASLALVVGTLAITSGVSSGGCSGGGPDVAAIPSPSGGQAGATTEFETPASCEGLLEQCAEMNCCASYEIPGGPFDRSCDEDCRSCVNPADEYFASVSDFSLDAFEVTVARFRQFVEQYPGSKPSELSGRNPHNADDFGWHASWDDMLLGTRTNLTEALEDPAACPDGKARWTASPKRNEQQPMNCVTWYEAQAFCIWDGGRLPTEAEWNYAASGGDESRVYPWPASTHPIDATRAVYAPDGAIEAGQPDAVGSRPDGRGKWGQYDLAGNVAEWVWDDYSVCYASAVECVDCGVTLGSAEKVARGGSFRSYSDRVTVATRDSISGAQRSADFGFRCARRHPVAEGS